MTFLDDLNERIPDGARWAYIAIVLLAIFAASVWFLLTQTEDHVAAAVIGTGNAMVCVYALRSEDRWAALGPAIAALAMTWAFIH